MILHTLQSLPPLYFFSNRLPHHRGTWNTREVVSLWISSASMVSLDQLFILLDIWAWHTKPDLRIVCVKEHDTRPQVPKYLSDQSSSMRTGIFWRFGSVLLMSCGGSDHSSKSRMDPSLSFNYCAKAVCIGGFQFSGCRYSRISFGNRLLRSQFFQNICRCEYPAFCLSLPPESLYIFQKYYLNSRFGELILNSPPAFSCRSAFPATDWTLSLFAICFQFLSFTQTPHFSMNPE